MNRRTKIIVSVAGIFIVTLALIGLTYAYFLTRINGNTNAKSISVSTAKLELTYSDNSSEILGSGKVLQPSSEPIGTKTFTVTNNGEDTNYSVVLENMSITNTSDGSSTEFYSNDFVYTLTCKDKSNNPCVNEVSEQTELPLSNGTILNTDIAKSDVHNYTLTLWYLETGIDQSADMGKALNAKINIIDPVRNNPYKLQKDTLAYHIINNSINRTNGTNFVSTPKTIPAQTGSSFEYIKAQDPTTFNSSLTSATSYYISYADDYTVNKTTGKFTLVNPTTIKYSTSVSASDIAGKYAYWSTTETTAKNTTNLSTIYKITTNTSDITSSTIKYASISSSASASNTISTERELSFAPDDYGTSYYYRGGVTDNYVNFAGMCWRIVRIEGDGSTKLILEDRNAECNSSSYTGNWSDGNSPAFGYDSNYRADFLNYSGGLADSFKSFQTTLAKKINTNLTDSSTQTEINTALSSKLKIDEWCYDENITEYKHYDSDYNLVPNPVDGGYTDEYYGAYTRIYTNKKPSLSCSGTKLTKFKGNTNMYVATLTADEMSFAGATVVSTNYNYYLMNTYAKDNYLYWWSLSPSNFHGGYGSDSAFSLNSGGNLNNNYDVDYDVNVSSRPAVSLKSGSVITGGEGTLEKPYIIG